MEDMRLGLKPDYLSIELGTKFGDYVIEVNIHNKEIFGGAGLGLSTNKFLSFSATLGWVLHDPPWREGESINRGRWISDKFLTGVSDNFSANRRFVGVGMTVVYNDDDGKEYKAFEVGVSTPQAGANRIYSINITQFIDAVHFDINRSGFYDQYTLSALLRQIVNYHIREEQQGKIGDFNRSPFWYA